MTHRFAREKECLSLFSSSLINRHRSYWNSAVSNAFNSNTILAEVFTTNSNVGHWSISIGLERVWSKSSLDRISTPVSKANRFYVNWIACSYDTISASRAVWKQPYVSMRMSVYIGPIRNQMEHVLKSRISEVSSTFDRRSTSKSNDKSSYWPRTVPFSKKHERSIRTNGKLFIWDAKKIRLIIDLWSSRIYHRSSYTTILIERRLLDQHGWISIPSNELCPSLH